MGQQHTGMGVHIRPRVLCLTRLQQNTRDDIVNLTNEFEERVIGKVLEGELALGGVAGISLAEDGMTVAGDDLATLEGGPDIGFDGVVCGVFTDLRLHFAEPEEDFLVGKAVEGACETVEGSTECEEGVGESGADEFTGVSGNVAAFVVTWVVLVCVD